MPTKGSGYIASKITCINGSINTFDNDNWTIESVHLITKGVLTYVPVTYKDIVSQLISLKSCVKYPIGDSL